MDNVEEKSIELPDNKLFSFPSKIVYHHYDNRIFVISVDTANWLILNNEEELAFFELLKKYQLKEALEHFSGSTESAESVLAQIIGRDFENTKVELKSIESSLHLYLTNDCNMRCPHCYMNAGIKNNNELEKSEILLLLQGAANHGVSHLILSGGEIMLCADLVEYINLASKLGMSVELLTNGTLLTEKFILEIKDKVNRVQVSIDGYDEISLTGNFKITTNNYERIFKPQDLGFDIAKPEELVGGASEEEAAQIFDAVLENRALPAQKNIVLANAAFGIQVLEKGQKDIEECIAIARESIDSGSALRTFKKFAELNS